MNDEDIPTTPEDNYQIVNSYLPLRGDYRIENCKIQNFFSTRIKRNSFS